MPDENDTVTQEQLREAEEIFNNSIDPKDHLTGSVTDFLKNE